MRFKAKPIGYIKSTFTDRNCKPITQDLISELHLSPELTSALDGIEDFSHILIIFWFNRIKNKNRKKLKIHPRGDLSNPITGVFATRSPSRPVPLGVTVAKLIERKNNILVVKGLDALDGTPVLDIKPYFPVLTDESEVKVANWFNKGQKNT